MATPALVDRVIDVLQHSQADSRMMAARELVEAGVLRSRGCLPRGTLETAASAELRSEQLQVIFAAIETADEELQSLLITGLGEWGGEEAAVDIAAQLNVAESPRIIDHCLAALERIGGPVSTTAIVRQILVGNPRTRKLAERHLLELASGGTGDLADPAEQGSLDGLSGRVFAVTDWRSFGEFNLADESFVPFVDFLSRYDRQYSQWASQPECAPVRMEGTSVVTALESPVGNRARGARLHVGQLLTGRVKTLTTVGAVLDLGGIEGFLLKELLPSRQNRFLHVGRTIKVRVVTVTPKIRVELREPSTPRFRGTLVRRGIASRLEQFAKVRETVQLEQSTPVTPSKSRTMSVRLKTKKSSKAGEGNVEGG